MRAKGRRKERTRSENVDGIACARRMVVSARERPHRIVWNVGQERELSPIQYTRTHLEEICYAKLNMPDSVVEIRRWFVDELVPIVGV